MDALRKALRRLTPEQEDDLLTIVEAAYGDGCWLPVSPAKKIAEYFLEDLIGQAKQVAAVESGFENPS